MPKSARQPSFNLLPDQLSFDENDQLALINENCREDNQQTLITKTNSSAQDFDGCGHDKEGLLDYADDQPAYDSFAQDFYACGHDEEGLLDHTDDQPAPNIARARQRMECVTDSQLAVLIQELGADFNGEGGGAGDHDRSLLVDKVLAWRKERGDFDDDDGEDQGGFVGDEVPQLTSDMRDVSETILCLGFLKSDLQFECLLRNIAYAGSDGKAQLISKLMDYKATLFLKGNSFQTLEEECK